MSWYDTGFVVLLVGLGLAFLWEARRWGAMVYIGNAQYGDADFWWQGALQFSNAMIWNNINLTFRMGYAIVTGLFVAALGPNFLHYHKLLCIAFLAVATLSYFVTRRIAGRMTATAIAALLVFAPYQAQWLAISTSDSTGLIWNLLALLCLMMALVEPARSRWDIGCGLFLAIGGLTRPLMNPFIAPALLLRLAAPAPSWRSRVAAAGIMVLAFLLPTVGWVGLYYAKTGSVAMAGTDSSALYAPSDPKIQVWRSDMYPPIEAAARKRYGTQKPTQAQLSAEFWRQTFHNYIHYRRYHFERGLQTILKVAEFSYERSGPGSHAFTVLRNAFLGLLAAALIISAWRANRIVNAGAVAVLLALWLVVPDSEQFIIIAAALGLLIAFPIVGIAPSAIAAYWWTGVAALWLSGGTSGPPLNDPFALNALGYRLGSQFLFVNDWLAALAFWLMAHLPVPAFSLSSTSRLQPPPVSRCAFIVHPSRIATHLLRSSGIALIVLLLTVAGIGASRIGYRSWRLSHVPPVPMPDVQAALASFCAGPGGGQVPNPDAPPVVVSDSRPFILLASTNPWKTRPQALMATGAVSALIWQVATQNRTMAMFFQQALRTPFQMTSQHTTVDFPGLLPESGWRNRQGLWIFRTFAEAAPRVDYVFEESHPQVQAYIPFGTDGLGFSLKSATWFPLTQYASALVAADALTVSNSRLDWRAFPSGDRNRRWFILMPADNSPAIGDRTVTVALDRAFGKKSLSLSFRVEPIPGQPPTAGLAGVYVQVFAIDGGGKRKLLTAKASPARGGAVDVALADIGTAIPADSRSVEVAFHDIARTEMVRVVEFQLTADDFAPTTADVYCRR